MIRQESAGHNLTLAMLLLLVATSLLMGCGPDQENPPPPAAKAKTTAPACGLTVNTIGWDAFYELASDLQAGRDVPRSRIDAYSQIEPVRLWVESMDYPPNTLKLSNWIETAFAPQVSDGKPVKRTADRRDFSRSFRYSFSHVDLINQQLDLYRTETTRCRLMEKLRLWIPPENLGQDWVLNFLPGKPEIRSEKNQMFVDTGVLAASSPAQLDRQLAALLYRSLGIIPGGNPLEYEGGEALAHGLRVMVNEGVIAYIEDLPDTYFNPDHPTLGKVDFITEDMFFNGVRTIGHLNNILPELFADPDVMMERGHTVTKALAGGGAFHKCGYAMTFTIVGHLGEDRLRGVRHSPPAWLAAFQEAALMNPVPQPQVGRVGVKLHQTMPPFTPEVFEALHALLLEYYPAP